MHYYENDEKYKLSIVVYKQEGLEQTYTLELCSIQECKVFLPNQLKKFLESFEYILEPHVKQLEMDKFYKLDLEFFGYNAHDFIVLNVCETKEDLETIH